MVVYKFNCDSPSNKLFEFKTVITLTLSKYYQPMKLTIIQ